MDEIDPRHGTINGYGNLKCRCDRCRAAWVAYQKKRRQQRSELIQPDDPRHGKVSFYFNYSCRCDLCRAARTERERRRREEAKNAGNADSGV